MKSFYEPDCPYADGCSDKGLRCNNCKHNKNKKKSHYEPENPFIIPWRGPYPPTTPKPYTPEWYIWLGI